MEKKEIKKALFFKTKERLRDVNPSVQTDTDLETERKEVSKAFDRWVNRLNKAKNDLDYKKTYDSGLNILCKFFYCPDDKLQILGFKRDFNTGELHTEYMTIEEVKRMKEPLVNGTSLKCEFLVEDTNVQFIKKELLPLNEDKTIDNFIEPVWVSESDINKMLDDCMDSLSRKSDAMILLPTIDGYYDDKYKSDVRKIAKGLKCLKSLIKKGYLIYAFIV